MLYHRRVTAPNQAASPEHHVGWRLVAVLLVLVLTGLPSESSRDLALEQDWYFDNLEEPAAVLLGARGKASEVPSRQDATDGMMLRANASSLIAASLPFSSSAAPSKAQPASLLPESTGPPGG
jgi:hypothetical protein